MLTLTLVLGSIGLLIYLVKTYFGRNNNYWKIREVLEFKNDSTLLETLQGKKSPNDLDIENYKFLGDQKYGGTVEFGTPLLMVKDLDLIKQIMVKDFDHFVDHRHFIKTDPLFSDSLFFLHGDDWKNMRTFLSPTFTSGKIRRMFHHFKRSGDKLTNYINTQHPVVDGGHEILVADVVGRFTSDVIGAVAFGMETDALTKKDSHFFTMAIRSNDISPKRLAKFALFTFFPSIANFFRMELIDKDVSQYFRGLLMSAFRAREQSREVREDFLQLLLEAKKEHGSTFSDEIMVSQAFLFFMAGFDTIANVLGETIYLLALHPEIQEKLYAEVEETMNSGNGDISYEAANKLEYLEMVISEVLRMFPAVARLERRCGKKWMVPGTKVELTEGTMIGVAAAAMHRDPKHYENPEEFNPERFNASNKADRNPYTYLPFGTGPRNCIGMRLALIEAKVALAVMVYNYNIQPIPGKTPIPMKLETFFGLIRIPTTLRLSMVPRLH